jgi:hypothetical protein
MPDKSTIKREKELRDLAGRTSKVLGLFPWRLGESITPKRGWRAYPMLLRLWT